MVDLIDTLVTFLCQQNTASNCQQFISAYSDPVQQLLFFLLIPVVFLIIFITLVSSEAVPKLGKKFGTLIGIVIIVFIIVQGYYHYFLIISKLWIYVLVLLVGGWFILKYVFARRSKKENAGGGGQGEYSYGSGGHGGKGSDLFGGYISGATKGLAARTSKYFKDAERRLQGQLKRLEDMRKSIDTATDQQAKAKFQASFNVEAGAVEGEIARLREVYGDAVDPLEKRLHHILGRH